MTKARQREGRRRRPTTFLVTRTIGLLFSVRPQSYHQRRAEQGPTGTNRPAGDHVGRPVDTKIDSACPNRQCDQHREGHDEDAQQSGFKAARQHDAYGEVDRGRHEGGPTRKAGSVYARAVGNQIRARAIKAIFQQGAQDHTTPDSQDDRDGIAKRAADNAANGFDPSVILTDWERGTVAMLPVGGRCGHSRSRPRTRRLRSRRA